MNILDKIMKPKAIAVIGASTKEKTIGSEIMQRLRDYKFTGNIYPVNPKGGMIEGFQAYTSIEEVPGEVDLAVIVVNSKFVLDTIDQCNRKGVKGLCIITAGFKETGAEGAGTFFPLSSAAVSISGRSTKSTTFTFFLDDIPAASASTINAAMTK